MGPVYIAFSANALDDEADVEIVPSHRTYTRIAPDADAIDAAADILAEARNPVLIVGDRGGAVGVALTRQSGLLNHSARRCMPVSIHR